MARTIRETSKTDSIGPISIGRPRWTTIVLAVSLVIFWAGVILKFLG